MAKRNARKIYKSSSEFKLESKQNKEDCAPAYQQGQLFEVKKTAFLRVSGNLGDGEYLELTSKKSWSDVNEDSPPAVYTGPCRLPAFSYYSRKVPEAAGTLLIYHRFLIDMRVYYLNEKTFKSAMNLID